MRSLDRRELDRDVEISVVPPTMGQAPPAESRQDHVERLGVHRGRLEKIHAAVRELVGRDPAADSELEAPAAHLVEHRNFFDEPQRRVEGQEVDERPEPDPARALRHRGQEDSGRRRHAESCGVMLGHVVGPEPRGLDGLDELQPMLVQRADRLVRPIDVIEDSESRRGHRPGSIQ